MNATIPSGWLVVDPMTFYMFMLMLFGLGLGGGLFILLYILRKVPETGDLIKAYFRKRVVIIDCLETGPVDLVPTEPMSEGEFKVSPFNFKVLPRFQNPLRARFWLRKSRIPVLFSYSGTTVAVAADVLAAVEVAEAPKEELPAGVKKWAEDHKLDLTVELEKKQKEKEKDSSRWHWTKKTVKDKVTETLFALDPRKLKAYFTEHYDPSQFRNLLKEHYQSGWEDGHGTKPKGYPKWLPLAIFLVVIAVIGIIIYAMGKH